MGGRCQRGPRGHRQGMESPPFRHVQLLRVPPLRGPVLVRPVGDGKADWRLPPRTAPRGDFRSPAPSLSRWGDSTLCRSSCPVLGFLPPILGGSAKQAVSAPSSRPSQRTGYLSFSGPVLYPRRPPPGSGGRDAPPLKSEHSAGPVPLGRQAPRPPHRVRPAIPPPWRQWP